MNQVPKNIPIKEDSIINLLQNSEIEFKTCPTLSNSLQNINTGFGESNELHYKSPCSKPILKVPLYKDNFLNEFVTEEDKAAARHALGLYNKGDVVAMSLLTAENKQPTTQDWSDNVILQLRKGDKFFTPITSTKAVFDTSGVTLDSKLNELNSLVKKQQKDIVAITQVSNSQTITSLGDVKVFLQGFSNEDKLKNTIDDMNQEMLRFEKTG